MSKSRRIGLNETSFQKNQIEVSVSKPEIISIDRTTTFDPVKNFGEGWSIVEEDERSLALTEIDIRVIRLVPVLRQNEIWLHGEERLRRLERAGHIRLDAKIFQTLFKNPELIHKHWGRLRKGVGSVYISFDGTILKNPAGERCVLRLFKPEGTRSWRAWQSVLSPLRYKWLATDPSAVLIR